MIDRLRDETGLGLPVALGVLAVVLVLGGWTVSNTDQLHRSSERDRGAKRALGPADAGIQRASWRLAQTTPSAVGTAQCITSTAAGESVGACNVAPVATPMGNGATYSYQVSAQHTAPGTCANLATLVGDRCVTATGTANGVNRRVQAILRRQVAPVTYTFSGLVGKTWTRLGNSIEAWVCSGETPARIGSNTSIEFGNSNTLGNSCGGTGSWGVAHPGTAGLVDGSPSPTPSNTSPPTTHTLPPVAIPTTYDNSALTGSGFVYDGGAAARQLRVTSNKTIAGGTYVLCSLTLDNGNLDIASPGVAKIYIDSPDRPGSTCPAGSGGFWAKNGEDTNWGAGGDVKDSVPAQRAPWLQLYVYGSSAWESGNRPCNGNKAGAVLICNSNKFAGTIYAPNSKVVLSNSVEFVGAIASDKLDLENSVKFRYPNGIGTQTVSEAVGDASPAQWTECRSTATGTAC